jgi:hypothetical protein
LLGRNLQNGEETLSQSIEVPATAGTLTMFGLFHLAGDPSAACRTCNVGAVEIVDGSNVIPVEGWTGLDDNGMWTAFTATVDAVPLRNATATFRLRATALNGSLTPLFFDSLALTADRCSP